MRSPEKLLLAVALLLVMPGRGTSQESNATQDRGNTKSESSTVEPLKAEAERLSQTKHTATIGGKKLSYVATVGRINLRDKEDKTKGSIYYFSYIQQDVEDARRRPITFAFNGGPGSSSVWLHMGLMGPKRVPISDDATHPRPPYKLIANKQSLLDLTDIVMIDPVSTGLSREAQGTKADKFHGYQEDIQSVGDFIERFISTNNRWGSPKFILGESYGTTRAAGLSGYLQDRHGMYFNGLVMVSSVLNFQTIRASTGNDLPHILFLPSFTATAWYHKRLDDKLQKNLRGTLREVEKFAIGEYSTALLKGARLTTDERKSVVEKLARYTGLSKAFVRRSNLRISMSRFAKELLRAKRRTTGRLDSRFVGIDRDAAGSSYEYDASSAAMTGAYTALLNEYLRNDLKYEPDRKYNISGSVRPWNYDSFTNRYVDSGETLRGAMTKNPSLKVFVANGYFDLATPYFATEYTYSQLQLDRTLRKNISMGYYEAGHMMYIHTPSLVRLKKDLIEFYRTAMPAAEASGK